MEITEMDSTKSLRRRQRMAPRLVTLPLRFFLFICAALAPWPSAAQPGGSDVFSSQGDYDRFAVGGAHRWYDNHSTDFKQKSSHCLAILDEAKAFQDKALALYEEAKRPGNSRRQTELVRQANEQIKLRGQKLKAFTDCVNQATRRPMLEARVQQNEPPSDQPSDEDPNIPSKTTPDGPTRRNEPSPDRGPDGPNPSLPQPAGPSTAPTGKKEPTPKPPSSSPTDSGGKNKVLSGGAQKGGKPGGDDDEGPPKKHPPLDGKTEKGGPGSNGSPPVTPPVNPPPFETAIKKICNLRELAALVDERYKSGNPVAVYQVTNRGPRTYLILLAGTELMEVFQANNAIEALRAYVEGLLPNPDSPYMKQILRVLNALPADSNLIIAGHSQGGMQGLNALRFLNRNPHTSGFFIDQVVTFGAPISQTDQLNPNAIIAGQNVPRFTFVEVTGDPIPQASLIPHQALQIAGVGRDMASWVPNHLHYKDSRELAGFDVLGIAGGKACLYLDVESFASYGAQAFPFQLPPRQAALPQRPPCQSKPTVQPTVRFEHDWYTATWGRDKTAKDFTRFQPSGDGVIVTDIFRERQPKGCAGVMLADALRGAGIKKPKWIRIADIKEEQPTLMELKEGLPVPQTVLGHVAVEAARELGGTVVASDHGIYKKYSFDDGKPWIELRLSYP